MVGICETCGIEAEIDKHHKNKDHGDNRPSNVARLCRWCHRVADGKQSHRSLTSDQIKAQYRAYFPRARAKRRS